jgi:predicted mannosyl-3-phosphoglycerate phosphatase (HAD superfamily)
MLEAADIAVIVMRHDGTHLDCHGVKRTLRTQQPGPTGWNTAVLEIIAGLKPRGPGTQGE